jgi:hypothetical protein
VPGCARQPDLVPSRVGTTAPRKARAWTRPSSLHIRRLHSAPGRQRSRDRAGEYMPAARPGQGADSGGCEAYPALRHIGVAFRRTIRCGERLSADPLRRMLSADPASSRQSTRRPDRSIARRVPNYACPTPHRRSGLRDRELVRAVSALQHIGCTVDSRSWLDRPIDLYRFR